MKQKTQLQKTRKKASTGVYKYKVLIFNDNIL